MPGFQAGFVLWVASVCLLWEFSEGLQGGAGGQSGSSPLPLPEPLLLLLLPLLLSPAVAPGVLQGGAGGQSGSSPLPQPEPLLQRRLVQLQQKLSHGLVSQEKECGLEEHVFPAFFSFHAFLLEKHGSIPASPSSCCCQLSRPQGVGQVPV